MREDRGPDRRGRGDPVGAPQALVVGRAQVEVREGQRSEGKGPDADEQPTARPQGPFLGAHLEGDLLGRLPELAEALELLVVDGVVFHVSL